MKNFLLTEITKRFPVPAIVEEDWLMSEIRESASTLATNYEEKISAGKVMGKDTLSLELLVQFLHTLNEDVVKFIGLQPSNFQTHPVVFIAVVRLDSEEVLWLTEWKIGKDERATEIRKRIDEAKRGL